ncbi:MAG: type IV secretion system protein [Patescibacteria group bacterium]|nr:type IV secretion system protein [Patescibacteria group bacterium]
MPLLKPLVAKAASGDTLYGKWYDASEIKLESHVDVWEDGQWHNDYNFLRVGNEPGKSSFKVRIRLILRSPETLTFAGNQWIGSPVRDGVKAPDKNGAFGGQNIYGLVGEGSAWGLKENVVCEDRNVAAIWRVWHTENIAFCYDKKEGEPNSRSDKREDASVTYKAGDEIYHNEISFQQKDFEKLGIVSPTSGDYRLFDFQVWPELVVNTGDHSLSDYVIAGAEGVIAGKAINQSAGIAESVAKGVNGAAAKALDLVKQIKNKLLTPSQATEELAKTMPQLSAQEAKAVAEAMINNFSKLSPTGTITRDMLDTVSSSIVRELAAKGMSQEASLAVANEALRQMAALAGKDAPKIVGATGEALERAAVQAAKTEAEKEAAKVAARTVAKTVAGQVVKGALKFVSVAGWAWTVADIIVYATSFENGPITYYSGNTHDVYIQVFKTEAAALAQKGEAPPDGVIINNGGKIGSGQNPTPSGSPLLGAVNELIGIVIGFLNELIYVIFYWLIAPLLEAMLSIHVYTDVFVAVIYPGWIVIRNVCNIVFIVALIAIAMGTLFRVESYQFRHLLVQLIIAALLINFSLVIAQAVLGLADTVQAQFLPDNLTVVRSLGRDMMLSYRDNSSGSITGVTSVSMSSLAMNGTFATTVKPLFYLALALGSFAVFAAITAYLVIRVVALWILLMVSPIAYAAGVLPTTSHYRSEWWGQFIKYAFFTPIMAFFLNIAALINDQQANNPVLKTVSSADFGGSTVAPFVFKVGSNILLLIFLVVALKVAEQFGIAGASTINKWAKEGIYAPFKGAGFLAQRGKGWATRKWNEKTVHWFLEGEGEKKPRSALSKAAFAMLNPVSFFKGWGKRAEELQHEAQEIAHAGGREVAEQMLTMGKLKIPYRQFVERSAENNYLKDYENMRKESLMTAAVAATNMHGAEGEMRKRAIVKAAAKNGYLDDLLAMKEFAEKYADADGTYYSAEVLNRFLFGYLGQSEQSMRFMAEDMEQLGKDTGHYEYLGHAVYDPDTNTFKRGMEVLGMTKGVGGRNIEELKNTHQAAFAIGELKKVGGRQRAGIAPHNLITLRAEVDENGFKTKDKTLYDITRKGRADGELDEYQLGAIGIFDPATLRDAHFAQSRLKEWIYSLEVDQTTGEVVVKDDADAARISSIWKVNPSFMKQMYSQITGVDVKDVTGIRLRKEDGSGKKTEMKIGNPSTMPMPVGNEVTNDVIKDKRIGLKDEQKKRIDAYLPSIVSLLYTCKIDETKARQELKAKCGIEEDKLEQQIIDRIHESIAMQLEQRYDPRAVIDAVDSRIVKEKHHGHASEGLPQGLKFNFNTRILHRLKEAYGKRKSLQKKDVREAIQKAYGDLVEYYEGKPEEGKVAEIEPGDLDRVAEHAVPISRGDLETLD